MTKKINSIVYVLVEADIHTHTHTYIYIRTVLPNISVIITLHEGGKTSMLNQTYCGTSFLSFIDNRSGVSHSVAESPRSPVPCLRPCRGSPRSLRWPRRDDDSREWHRGGTLLEVVVMNGWNNWVNDEWLIMISDG